MTMTHEMTEAMEESQRLRSKFRLSAIPMAKAGLFTLEDVMEWDELFDGFHVLLLAALARVSGKTQEPPEPTATDELLAACEAVTADLGMGPAPSPKDAEMILREIIDDHYQRLTDAIDRVKGVNLC